MTATPQNAFAFPYHTCRNISSPEDESSDRKVYAGHAPASSVLMLEDNENVREYLVDVQGKQKRSPTLVHQAIRKTLVDTPDIFSILNGGMVIVAKSAVVDDKAKMITLENPSIINGSQTQGELKRYFQKAAGNPEFTPSIRYEIIITRDENLVAEISIARNFQNDVRAISIAGRKGQLDELEEAIRRHFPDANLRKRETDLVTDEDDGFLDTEKVIQVIFALMPPEILKRIGGAGDQTELTNKAFSYSQKTRCLKLFQKIEADTSLEDVFDCLLDLAGPAWQLYEKWKSHQKFKGTRLRSIEREKGAVVSVPDGIIFPIIAAHSAFVSQDNNGRWAPRIPIAFNDEELIEAAAQAYTEIAGSSPQLMGKSKACYTTLHRITSIYARLSTKTADIFS
ncbi:AIPR family protein [Rhizobium lusitanum]|uniref:AIPR protein n=1 Tax=Rhizobium lusitanum TaxID=293958 RepID=A0A1C3UYI3_9HYPH|nr:AIPR family protein [Rhizobium lusitanum]SCB20563.1 AIPR protein [Rhizobium lusitanum]